MSEDFLSIWLREDGREKEERIMELDQETKEETSKKRMRQEEKIENETLCAERRCVGSASAEAFDTSPAAILTNRCNFFEAAITN